MPKSSTKQKSARSSAAIGRRIPRQHRARNTVENIKQAALMLLNKDGVGACGTERIAKRAGVNIGSVYQYFRNREAILSSLYEDVAAEFGEALELRLPRLLEMPTEKAVAYTVDLLISMHEQNRLVLLQLVNEMPQLGAAEQPTSLVNMTEHVTRSYLAKHLTGLAPRELDRMAFFLQQIILGCIMAYLRGSYPRISRKEFTRDLARIIAAYIDGR